MDPIGFPAVDVFVDSELMFSKGEKKVKKKRETTRISGPRKKKKDKEKTFPMRLCAQRAAYILGSR